MKMLPLVMKHFYPTAKIHDITRHIRWEGAERVYLELDDQGRAPKADHKRHHKSDGLIFAPELPYHRGTDFNYMKWKWHDTITLDFECRREPHAKYGVALSFACEGGQVDFTDHIVMEEQDRARLLGDMASVVRSSGAPGALITEWEWSPECSGWIYKMPRPDKKKSNFSRTVLATIMELAEGMDIEELEYRLSCARPQDDNWAVHLPRVVNVFPPSHLHVPLPFVSTHVCALACARGRAPAHVCAKRAGKPILGGMRQTGSESSGVDGRWPALVAVKVACAQSELSKE